MKALSKEFGKEGFREKLKAISVAEDSSRNGMTYVRKTGGQPLTFWEPDYWSKSFPWLFPYGDGVYGLSRRTAVNFQQWASLMLLRTELVYDCCGADPSSACPLTQRKEADSTRSCRQCATPQASVRLSTPRWFACQDFLFTVYDSWRRLETLRATNIMVNRRGFGQDLKVIADTKADMLSSAMKAIGTENNANVLRMKEIPGPLRQAMRNVFLMTGHVVGTDGARIMLRHEQSGMMARYGAFGAFVTLNVNDIGNPLLIEMFDSCNGLKGETCLDNFGKQRQYRLSLLDEVNDIPSKAAVKKMLTDNPVVQARFFIIMYQLFLIHILGLTSVDELLRHNGWVDGTKYPDGFAASFCSGCCSPIAAGHFPIEEQSRLSCHGHGVLVFVSQKTLAWFRDIMSGSTSEGRERLAAWRTAVMRAVETTQNTSARVVPTVLLGKKPSFPTESPYYSASMQKADKYDGSALGCAKNPDATNDTVPLQPKHPLQSEIDFHADHPEQSQASPQERLQTGTACSVTPTFLRNPITQSVCSHSDCLENDTRNIDYAQLAYCDFLACKEASLMHVHSKSCYKYETAAGDKRLLNCRFGVQRTVQVWLKKENHKGKKVCKEFHILCSGRPLVRPDADNDTLTGLQVNSNTAAADPGRCKTIQCHPREGTTLTGALSAVRCNIDWQDLRTTLSAVMQFMLTPQMLVHAWLQLHLTCGGHAPTFDTAASKRLENLGCLLDENDFSKLQRCSRRFRWKFLGPSHLAHACTIGDRCKDHSHRAFHSAFFDFAVDDLRNSKNISFYVSTYSTKPNIKGSKLLLQLERGLRRLEAEVENESDKQLVEKTMDAEASAEEIKHKAKRILFRLWSSANYSLLKGPVLQCIQLLTRREVFRTHRFWQINLKRFMWIGFETLRRTTTSLESAGELEPQPVENLTIQASTDSSVTASFQGTAFIDDWLHRGEELEFMCASLNGFALELPIFEIDAA